MKKPTLAQLLVLAEIHNATQRQGYPPSLQEIGRARHMGGNSASCHLLALRRRGLLTWESHTSRSYRVTEAGWDVLWANSTAD